MAVDRTPVLVGPTAVGKTAIAVALARHLPIEVLSADSRQIYRRLDIGTAKPTPAERAAVPHHLLDLVDVGARYSAGRFARDAAEALVAVRRGGRLPMVVGGTGLYVRALAEGLFVEPPLDPARRAELAVRLEALPNAELVRWAGRLDPGYAGGGRQRALRAIEVALLTGKPLSAWQRLARGQGLIRPWYVRLTVPRAVLHQRIRRRALQMLQQGIVEETAAALADGAAPGAPGLDGVGYRETVAFLVEGRGTRETLAEAIAVSTRQYAKRQETWFRHQLGADAIVLDATRPPEALAEEIAARWAAAARG